MLTRERFDAMVADLDDLELLETIDLLDETPDAPDADTKRPLLLAEAQRRLGNWLEPTESPDDLTALSWANCRKVMFADILPDGYAGKGGVT